ncbi:hypothetical protein M9194_09820 [Vibrio sp. S4M6]|uniref:hypothetical protein n=1 Tax=Vibrio sinus TaxID=2946865 RepID=UPI002029DA6C|nr:hypothetical protein [Vibrio sinus]MCL9781722.1 hypothetical protein [Vibrio sinus]
MKVKHATLVSTIAILVGAGTAGVAFAKSLKNQSSSDQSQFTIDRHNMIDNLNLVDSFTISASDIQDAIIRNSNKTVTLGTFCSYSNHKNKELPLTVSSRDGSYKLVGTGKVSGLKVNYQVAVNNVNMPYNRATIVTAKGGKDHTSCRGFAEQIKLTIPATDLKAAKAGTYRARLNLATSST